MIDNATRIDAAARAILARRAEQLTASWEVTFTVAEPGEERVIDARLTEYARAILAGLTPNMLDDARQAVRRLVHMERDQLGSGPEGHLSERDLAPLLHALHIDPEETP